MDDIWLYPKCYICSANFDYPAECKIRPGVYSYKDDFELFWNYDAWNHYFRLSKSLTYPSQSLCFLSRPMPTLLVLTNTSHYTQFSMTHRWICVGSLASHTTFSKTTGTLQHFLCRGMKI